jgi:hypothetical protein
MTEEDEGEEMKATDIRWTRTLIRRKGGRPSFIDNRTAKEYITYWHTCRPTNSGGRKLCLITIDNKRFQQSSPVLRRPLFIAEFSCLKMYIFRAVNSSGSFSLFCLIISKTVSFTEKWTGYKMHASSLFSANLVRLILRRSQLSSYVKCPLLFFFILTKTGMFQQI